MKTLIRYSARLVVIGVVTFGAYVYGRYQSDLEAAQTRVNSGSRTVETRCGMIEYAEAGQGAPVLMVHGAGGGYDQGLLLAQAMLGDGFRVIAPSRFGYLGTERRADGSPTAQAKAHACLLDALGIDRVAVVGVSAGGPSSLMFAQLYPARTTALIMIAAVSPQLQPERDTPDWTLKAMFSTDFFTWAMLTAGREQMIAMLGVTREVQATLTPQEQQWAEEMLRAMLPITQRAEGIRDDFYIDRSGFRLDQIAAPTLVVHAVDDKLVFYEENGKYTVDHIPGAKSITLSNGGHFLMGQHNQVRSEVTVFLKSQLTQLDVWK